MRDQQERVRGGEGAAIERLPFAVVVDNVRSLWNVGSMFRTADSCGVRLMLLTGITGCPPRPELTKTALGADEAVACLAEGVIRDGDLLDAGVIFGTGFAPFRGGPLQYARNRGLESVQDRLRALAGKYGDRFEPHPGWSEL